MIRYLVLWMLLAGLGQGLAFGQAEPDDEEVRAKAALELVSKTAGDFVVATKPANGEAVSLKLNESPLLRWSNPEAGSVHGAVYLWTDDNRPQLVASIFKWYSPHKWLDAELHSLSEAPLVAQRDGKSFWATGTKAITFRRISGEVPGDTPLKRLAQMRTIVRGLNAEHTPRGTQDHSPLRVLDKPLYRYQSTKHGVVDGGLFAFVWATDPEVLAMIEAKDKDGEAYWQVSFVRQTSCALRVKNKEETLYEVEELPWPVAFSNSELYNIIRISGGE